MTRTQICLYLESWIAKTSERRGFLEEGARASHCHILPYPGKKIHLDNYVLDFYLRRAVRSSRAAVLKLFKGWSMWLSKDSVVKLGSGGVSYQKIFEGVEPSQL